jgi:peptide/nickel transport system substrate-binding protein
MKSTKWSKLLALVLALAMIFSVLAGCSKTDDTSTDETTSDQTETVEGDSTETPSDTGSADTSASDTLVVGYSNFSEKFSPFFASSAYDQDVANMVTPYLLSSDRTGAIIYNGIEGETIAYNGTDYTYYGLADLVVTENEDGTVDYDFTLRDDVTFSDGVPVTIDDVIFSMYVLCDPSYDGSATLYAVPIEGMDEYRSGMSTVWSLIWNDLAAGNDTSASEYYTADDAATFDSALTIAGSAFAQEIVDYVAANYISYAPDYFGHEEDEVTGSEGLQVAFGMVMWGFGDVDENDVLTTSVTGATFDLAAGEYPTTEDYWNEILNAYGYDLSDSGINAESANSTIDTLIADTLLEVAPELAASVQTGDSAANISGIIKTGDYSVRVRLTKVDATAIYQLAVPVAPLHYYGDESLYDYDNNQFGFTKGDLSGVKSVTTTPVGAGPYKFVEYTDGIVYFEANDSYFLGAPKIQYVRFQEVSDSDKTTGVYSGTLDISDPSISEATVAVIKEQNGGEMSGDVITTVAVDNLGYGYIGIQADVVNVGGDPDSEASKDLRKAFATLFSVYRDTVIDSYYGERASVIQYPITNTSWAAPRPADEGYEIAFSRDVDGNSIYDSSMTDDDRYAAALDAAIGFLKAAGYTWDDASGKFTAAPEGASLSYEFQIPADGKGDHPSFGIVTAASAALATVGIDLQVTDLSNSSTLWDALDAGTCAMWAAAWSATVDPDMYQIYHGDNVVGHGGTDSNKYGINDATLNELIVEARSTTDQTFRKATYKECLDIILDWAVEVPIYQRQNAFIFSTERVNVDTITPDITPFWGWMAEIEKLELN